MIIKEKIKLKPLLKTQTIAKKTSSLTSSHDEINNIYKIFSYENK